MPRQCIDHLPFPVRKQRSKVLRTGFETIQQAIDEDLLRARKLASPAATESALIDRDAALDLAKRLKEGARTRGGGRTLASKRSMRRLRLRFAAALGQFLEREATSSSALFTVISRRWNLSPEGLAEMSARRLLQSFRADLNRCGASGARGSLIAAIDLEFEPHRRIFVLHLHGVAVGNMIDVLNRLRRTPKYRPVRTECEGLVPIFRPIVLQQLISREVAQALTYVLKSYWTSTWRGPLKEDGKFRTARRSQRIPEPYHSLALLWLDRHSLKDITLMVGMEAGSFGFRSTRPNLPGRRR